MKIKRKLKKMVLDNKGMSLLEILISLFLLGIVVSTFLGMFLYAFRNTVESQEITSRTYAMQSRAEEIRGMVYRDLIDEDNSKQAFDSDNNGEDDCFIQMTFEPFGVNDSSSVSGDTVFVHLIFYFEKIMLIGAQGQTLYENAKGASAIVLSLSQTNGTCSLGINGETISFDRGNENTNVVVMVNLDIKDLGWNNNLNIYGDTADVDVKVYAGNQTIISEFSSSIAFREFSGIHNASTSLVKVNLDIYEEEDDPKPILSMTEVVEIYNGEGDWS